MGNINNKEESLQKEKKIKFNIESDSITCFDRVYNLWNNGIFKKYDLLIEKHILLKTKYEELKKNYDSLIIKKTN